MTRNPQGLTNLARRLNFHVRGSLFGSNGGVTREGFVDFPGIRETRKHTLANTPPPTNIMTPMFRPNTPASSAAPHPVRAAPTIAAMTMNTTFHAFNIVMRIAARRNTTMDANRIITVLIAAVLQTRKGPASSRLHALSRIFLREYPRPRKVLLQTFSASRRFGLLRELDWLGL